MAQFDPSVLQDVGSNLQPDFAGDTAKALTLADLYDQRTLTKSKIRADSQSQEDMTYAKQILAGKDLSKLEDQNSAVAKITQRNPQMGMELMRGFQGQQKQQNDINREQLELYNTKNDIIGGAMLQLKQKHDQIFQDLQGKFPNAPPQQIEQQIHDQMKGDVMTTVKSLAQAKLPNGTPLLDKTDAEVIQNGFGQGYSRSFVDSAVSRSQQAREAIKQRLAERKEDNTERATTAAIAGRERSGDQRDRQLGISEATLALRAKKADQARADFSGQNGELMAALAERGISLPAGFRSKEQQVAMLNALWKRNEGLDADAIADKVRTGAIDLAALKKETQVAATQVGKVSLAGNELVTFGDQVLEASKDVPRGSFVPFGKLSQMADTAISDPKLLRFKVKMQALNNAYDQLAARGGTDAAKREHVHQLFQTAASDEAVQALVQAVKEEAQGAEKAAERTMRVPGSKTLPDESGAGPKPAAGAPTVMKFDAQGNPVP